MIHPSSYSSFVQKFRQFRRCWSSTQAHPNPSASYFGSGWNNNSNLKYALGGWTFFILENVILSENRAAIIASLNGKMDDPATLSCSGHEPPDESNYRLLYGTCSTIATVSILYGYRQLRIAASQLKSCIPLNTFGRSGRVAAVSMISLGLVLMSQTLPKLQIPVEFVLPIPKKEEQLSTATAPGGLIESTQGSDESKSWSMKIRCPFDFSSSKHQNGNLNDYNVHGVERITRHPGLWSFGLVCAGNAFLQPTSGLGLWMTGPFLVALFGGYHQDSRASRNMGESFPSAAYEQQTSNVPFMAMLLGKQKEQNVMSSFYIFLTQELKPINAFAAVIVAALYVANRRPIPAVAICTKVAATAKKA
jgi:NnrU protein